MAEGMFLERGFIGTACPPGIRPIFGILLAVIVIAALFLAIAFQGDRRTANLDSPNV